MDIQLPKDVQFILNTLSEAGHAAYIVGGCLRDAVMGISPKDFDFTTSALPHEVKSLFPRCVDTGIDHGTVTVVIDRSNYEVTTFRMDGVYLDGRRPEDVTFTADIKEDLSRRDFSMNAIAYSPLEGLVDPFDGLADIRKKNIRCVGFAPARFEEDALRMMRAVRFAAQLDFSIDPDTFVAILSMAERLSLVSMERVREEFTKTLAGQNPAALVLLEETRLLPQILRGADFNGDIGKIIPWLIQCPKEPAMLYALFLFDSFIGCRDEAKDRAKDRAKNFMRHLKFDNQTVNETTSLVRYLKEPLANNRYAVKVLLNKIGPVQFGKLLTLKKIICPRKACHWESLRVVSDDILMSGECFLLKDLAVNGQDLIEAGIPAGKWLGRILADLLNLVMIDPSLNQKEQLLKLVSSGGL